MKNGKYRFILILLGFIAISMLSRFIFNRVPEDTGPTESAQVGAVALLTDSEFHYRFQTDGFLEETGLITDSSSSYWWLNSGGRMILGGGIGKTIQKDSGISQFWKKAYNQSNPTDTEEGVHPQNIFRLLTRKKWAQGLQEIHFKINNIRMSDSPNRNESNGFLLMSRYQDSDNLYYSGLRVDGHAVIKKKINGVYYTLAETPVFFSETFYNRNTNPNLIQGAAWIGIKSRITTDRDKNVHITLYIDKENSGKWQEVLNTTDTGKDAPVITKEGLSGIRSDFMDVEFDDYIISRIL